MDNIFDLRILSGRSLVANVLFGLAIVGFSGMHSAVMGAEGANNTPTGSGDGLRGVYYGTAKQDGTVKQDAVKDRVGKLAIELSEAAGPKTVRVDHPFRTGDKFRFKVSSNQDGWFYILHRSASEELRLLWPRLAADNKDEYLDMNRINAGQTYTVPSSPAYFIFDDEVGTEYFYAVVATKRKIPQFIAQGAVSSEVVASTDTSGRSKRIVNFGVRSGTTATAKSLRGVLYDPGREDADPYLYFATPADDDNQSTFVEFQLKHQE